MVGVNLAKIAFESPILFSRLMTLGKTLVMSVGMIPFATMFSLLFLQLESLAATSESPAPASITIGYVPENGSDPKSKSGGLTELIETQTGIKVKSYIGTDARDLAGKLIEGKIDFAFLSALAYVEAEEQTPIKVLLKKVWERGYYHSVLITSAKSKIRKPSDLKGRKIAFVDEKSASGYLYPLQLFRQLAFDPAKDLKSVFSGSHLKSVEMLKRADVEAIAVFANDREGRESAWTRAKGKAADVRVIWSSDGIPNDPFCVRSDFYEKYPKIAHDLMFGLIEVSEDSVLGPKLKRLLGAEGLMMATSLQYEPVRKLFRMLKEENK